MSISPADYSSWHDVRTELMSEAKTGFKARVESELTAAKGENLDELRAAFHQEERAIEHMIDHEVSAQLVIPLSTGHRIISHPFKRRCTPSRPRSTSRTTSSASERVTVCDARFGLRVV